MKLRLPQRRRWRVVLYIVSILLIALAIDLVVVQVAKRVPHDRETTFFTGPVLPDGRIDYLTVVENHFGEGVTPANNAAVPIVEALGRAGLARNQPRDGITARLGMPPLPDQGPYFAPLEKDVPDEVLTRPWSAAQHPDVAE